MVEGFECPTDSGASQGHTSTRIQEPLAGLLGSPMANWSWETPCYGGKQRGLETPWCSPRKAVGAGRGERGLGFSAWAAVPATWPQISGGRWMDGRMDGGMDGWRNGWMDGRMDGWTDGWMDRWMDGWMDGWTDGWMDGQTDGWMDGLKDGWMDGRMDGWMDGWTDGQTDGWMDGWMDRRMDAWTEGRMDGMMESTRVSSKTLSPLIHLPLHLSISCSLRQMFSYSSGSFSNNDTCDKCSLFAALDAKITGLETWLKNL
ncbi:F-box and leucine-rich repeat protein 13 [Sarotherodon galilaeus]